MNSASKWLFVFPVSVCALGMIVGLNRIASVPFKDPTGSLLLSSLVAPYAWVYIGASAAPKGRFLVASLLALCYLVAMSTQFSNVFACPSSLNDLGSLLALPACALAIYHVCCDELAAAPVMKWAVATRN